MDNPLTVPAASVSELQAAWEKGHTGICSESDRPRILRSEPCIQAGTSETEEPQADVPGVGRMPIANLRGRDQVAGEMPPALRTHLRDQILIRLMFAARDLAEKNLGRALFLSGKAGLFCRECGCAAKDVVHLNHSALCGTGRVLGFIEELQAVCEVSSNSNRKEVAPAEGEGRAGDGIRSRGPLDEPWKFTSGSRGYSICDSEGSVVIDLEGWGSSADGKRLALMERIVDCVNTLAPFAVKGGAR